MTAILKLFIKLFIFIWITFMVLQYLMSLDGNDPIFMDHFFLISLSGAFVFATLFTVVHLMRLKELGVHTFDDSTLSTHQSQTISSDIQPDRMMELLHSHPYFKNAEFFRKSDHILILTRLNLPSWGEIIDISFLANNRIKISCKPKYGIVLLDAGRSVQYVNTIVQLVKN